MTAASLDLPGPDEATHSPVGARVVRAGEFHPTDKACFICGASNGTQVELLDKSMCRDRVSCYRRWRKALSL